MVIYKITNLINEKFYIGKTVKSLEERFNRHLIRKSSPKLTAAIQKYGAQNFKIEKIDQAIDLKELNEKEKYWIETLRATEVGYNLSKGGDGGQMTGEALEKIRLHAKNRRCSLSTRKKMSESRQGRKNSRSKKVLVTVDNVIQLCFFSIKEASDFIGVSHSTGMALAKGIKASKKNVKIECIGE